MSQSGDPSERVISRAEQIVAECLAAILHSTAVGEGIAESPQLKELSSALEYFVPEVLREIHGDWKWESLDGVFPLETKKTRERTMSLFGKCILITDQTLAPIHVELQLSPAGNKIDWAACKLRPFGLSEKKLYEMMQNKEALDWTYRVTFGQLAE